MDPSATAVYATFALDGSRKSWVVYQLIIKIIVAALSTMLDVKQNKGNYTYT